MKVDDVMNKLADHFGGGEDIRAWLSKEDEKLVRAVLMQLEEDRFTAGYEHGKRELASDLRHLLGAAATPGR